MFQRIKKKNIKKIYLMNQKAEKLSKDEKLKKLSFKEKFTKIYKVLKSVPTGCSYVLKNCTNSIKNSKNSIKNCKNSFKSFFPADSFIVLKIKTFRNSFSPDFSKKNVIRIVSGKLKSLKDLGMSKAFSKKNVVRIVSGKLKSLKNVRLPKRFYCKLGSFLVYLYALVEGCVKFCQALQWKHKWIRRLVLKSAWASFTLKFRSRWSGYLLYIILTKLFLKRKEARYNETVIFDTSYFLKHHISHAFQLTMTIGLPELLFNAFLDEEDFNARYLRSLFLIHCYVLAYIPCMINVLLGRYNDMGMVSEAVLYWIGDAPENEPNGPKLTNAYWMPTSKAYKDYKKKTNSKTEEKEEDLEFELEFQEDSELRKESKLHKMREAEKDLKLKLQKELDIQIKEYLQFDQDSESELEQDLEIQEEIRRIME